MLETKQTFIHVEKADLPLTGGESVNNFLSMIREEVRAHVFKKLKIKVDRSRSKGTDVWVMDVFGDHVIAEVNSWGEKKPQKTRFISIPMHRDSSGLLVLGDPVEVVRRVNYVPKTPVKKNDDGSDIQEPVEKSFWAGVL